MTQKLIRLLLGLLFAIVFALPQLLGQQQSPYKNLRTAVNTPVFDTISGVNLDIDAVSPVPKHGNVSVSVIVQGGSGNPYVFEVQYQPDAGFIGVDTFVLEYDYGNAYPYLVYRAFKVCVMPSLVTAKEDYAVTNAGQAVTIDVLANDEAAWGPLSISSLPLINNGTATVSNNTVIFTPKPGFTGVAHVNYTVCDALNTCQTSSIHIGVNNGLPPADTLKVFTNKNKALRIPLTFGAYTLFQPPANGMVTLFAGKSLRYVPADGFTGTDHFVIKTTLNGLDYLKNFDVEVFPVQSPNVMAIDDIQFTPKGRAITFNVRDNDIGNLLVRSWVLPANFPGTLTGTNGIGDVTFTPNPGFSGVATFSYKIGTSSAPALETATVKIVVDNLAPPANYFPHVLRTPKETPLILHYDLPYQDFSFTILDQPHLGVINYFPGFTTQTYNGQSISGNNLLVFTPFPDSLGETDFPLLFCGPNGECVTTKIRLNIVEITATDPPFCLAECAWPGDANADGIANNKDLLTYGYYMGFDGINRVNGSADWYGQYSDNWNDLFTGLTHDLKHLDADGNGSLNESDINTLHANYNEAHNLLPKTVVTDKGLPFFLELLTPNPGPGEPIRIQVSLGSENIPAIDIYGFTFDMSLSPGVVDSAFKMTFYDNSWLNLNSPSITLAERPAVGRFETAFSRTNGQPASGYGPVGVVEIIIVEIIVGGPQNNRTELTLNPTITLADGSTSTGAPITLEIPIETKERSANNPVVNAQGLSVFPSPAHDALYVSWETNNPIEALSLLDMHAKLLLKKNDLQEAQTELNVSNLPSGMYILSARTATGVISKKVQVQR